MAVMGVLAYNEADWIGKVLTPAIEARRQGILSSIAVVDDGSTDITAAYSSLYLGRKNDEPLGEGEFFSKGARIFRYPEGAVISHDKNRGKIWGLVALTRYAASEGSGIIFMTDADMLNLTCARIRSFIGSIECGKEDMVSSGYMQDNSADGFWCPSNISGFRAIKTKALSPLLEAAENIESGTIPKGSITRKWMEYMSCGGFGLEMMLEELITKRKTVNVKNLKSRARGGGSTPLPTIRDEMDGPGEITQDRLQKADNLRRINSICCLGGDTSGFSRQARSDLASKINPSEITRLSPEDIRAKLQEMENRRKKTVIKT
jgi:glycosyltransferase involved in cell wall biosynthesis